MQLTAKNISKSFAATKALEDVSVTFRSGEIRAIVGENGAGKSTLFKVISGVHQKDAGEVDLDGIPFKPVNHIEAAKQGVAYVFQETMINPFISVSENIFMDRLREFRSAIGMINYQKLEQAAQVLLDSMGANINVKKSLFDLDLGQWKIVEIARALSYDPKVIFFDESTAYLNTNEIASFLGVMKVLKQKGLAIGFVSHHMNEVFEIADVATIMKDGHWIADKVVKEVTVGEIQQLMVGRNIENLYPDKKSVVSHEPVIRVDGLTHGKELNNVSFTLHKGEILCIGGLKGSGGEEILAALVGDVKPDKGEIVLNGKHYAPSGPSDALRNKIALLPGERSLEGLIVDFSIKDNINLGALPTKGPFVDEAQETKIADDMIRQVNIKAGSSDVACTTLSGGNMQKVVLGKCLATHPEIILLNNPTRGIDVGARMEIYNLIRKLSENGISILLLSEDLVEIIGLGDRTMIMRKGEISKVYDFGETPSEENMICFMT